MSEFKNDYNYQASEQAAMEELLTAEEDAVKASLKKEKNFILTEIANANNIFLQKLDTDTKKNLIESSLSMTETAKQALDAYMKRVWGISIETVAKRDDAKIAKIDSGLYMAICQALTVSCCDQLANLTDKVIKRKDKDGKPVDGKFGPNTLFAMNEVFSNNADLKGHKFNGLLSDGTDSTTLLNQLMKSAAANNTNTQTQTPTPTSPTTPTAPGNNPTTPNTPGATPPITPPDSNTTTAPDSALVKPPVAPADSSANDSLPPAAIPADPEKEKANQEQLLKDFIKNSKGLLQINPTAKATFNDKNEMTTDAFGNSMTADTKDEITIGGMKFIINYVDDLTTLTTLSGQGIEIKSGKGFINKVFDIDIIGKEDKEQLFIQFSLYKGYIIGPDGSPLTIKGETFLEHISLVPRNKNVIMIGAESYDITTGELIDIDGFGNKIITLKSIDELPASWTEKIQYRMILDDEVHAFFSNHTAIRLSWNSWRKKRSKDDKGVLTINGEEIKPDAVTAPAATLPVAPVDTNTTSVPDSALVKPPVAPADTNAVDSLPPAPKPTPKEGLDERGNTIKKITSLSELPQSSKEKIQYQITIGKRTYSLRNNNNIYDPTGGLSGKWSRDSDNNFCINGRKVVKTDTGSYYILLPNKQKAISIEDPTIEGIQWQKDTKGNILIDKVLSPEDGNGIIAKPIIAKESFDKRDNTIKKISSLSELPPSWEGKVQYEVTLGKNIYRFGNNGNMLDVTNNRQRERRSTVGNNLYINTPGKIDSYNIVTAGGKTYMLIDNSKSFLGSGFARDLGEPTRDGTMWRRRDTGKRQYATIDKKNGESIEVEFDILQEESEPAPAVTPPVAPADSNATTVPDSALVKPPVAPADSIAPTDSVTIDENGVRGSI